MASTTTLRWRRSAPQLHALRQVEREIRATDPHGRRKYLREFSEAFRTYQALLTPEAFTQEIMSADILLVGDYHALPASQLYAARLLEQVAARRPVLLAVETVFARDQHVLDAWTSGAIEDAELRERIRFDLDWGYDWEPFAALLHSARVHAEGIYGLDCMPRGDLRRIATRDRHAAAKIAEIRASHPGTVLIVLFGESHLAPTHMPQEVRALRPRDRMVTVLQNIDELFWRASGERCERVEAVQVSTDVLCVFQATPLEKYESYRLYLDRWRRVRPSEPVDLAPACYNIIDALLRMLNIDKYSPLTKGQAIVDELPEVQYKPTAEQFRRGLVRRGLGEQEIHAVLHDIDRRGSCYVPQLNAVLVRHFDVARAAEHAARFVHRICSARQSSDDGDAHNQFYRQVIGDALAAFGVRALCPTRPVRRENDLFPLYSLEGEAVEQQGICGYREFMSMIDFLVLHKDYEASALHYREVPPLIIEGVAWNGARRAFLTDWLGAMLGSELHEAYVHGRISRRSLRALFFRDLSQEARTAYFVTARRIRKPKRRLLA